MDIDVYQPCPCGSGKKIKFCCCKDIPGDLDKVVRAIEGEQRLAALDLLDRTISAKGPRPALLSLRNGLLMELGRFEEAERGVAQFAEQQPQSSVAKAQAAGVATAAGRIDEALNLWQDALDLAGEEISPEVFEVAWLLGRAFLVDGRLLTSMALWRWVRSVAEDDDPGALRLLTDVHQSRDTPLLFKWSWIILETPANYSGAAKFHEAARMASLGRWRESLAQFQALAAEAPHPAVWQNIGVLLLWLGRRAEAVAALRVAARQANAPLDDAVDQEALALLLEEPAEEEQLADVRLVFQLHETENLLERLVSDKRAVRMNFDVRAFTAAEQTPPKAIYGLLDRPALASGDDISIENIPRVIGAIYVFGRQTDREPQLEFHVRRGDGFDARLQALRDIAGESLGEQREEEVLGHTSRVSDALTWSWRLPDDVPPQRREELVGQQRQRTLSEVWPNLPLPVLDGQSLRQAAADPAQRTAVLGAIWLQELASLQARWTFDFDALRRELGLPTPEPLVVTREQFDLLPTHRLIRLDAANLPDDILADAFVQAAFNRFDAAVLKLGAAIVARGDTWRSEQAPLERVYLDMSAASTSFPEALASMQKGRDLIISQGRSPASLLVAEISLRLGFGETDGVMSLIQRVQSHHGKEPGVLQMLMSTLVSHGVVSPDGTPRGPTPAPVSTPAAEPERGSVWTPDAPPAAAAEGGPSKLWLPGQD